MSHESIKTALSDAVNQTAANIPLYAVHPDKDFTRIRKISAADLISFLVSCGSSSTRLELLDFFGMVPNAPSASAFNQQRAKLKSDALEAVFHQFNSSVLTMGKNWTIVSLPRMATSLLYSANFLFPRRNILFPRDIP